MHIAISEGDPTGYSVRLLILAPEVESLPDLKPLSGEAEIAELKRAGIARILWLEALIGEVSEQDLSDTLQEGNYTALQIITHGAKDGIMLSSSWLPGRELGRMLSQHDVNLVVAMTCRSEGLWQEIAWAGVEHIITTDDEITNRTARRFTREFYRELVRSSDVARAVAYAQSRLPEVEARKFVLHLREELTEPVPDDPVLRELRVIREQLEQTRHEIVAHRAEMTHWHSETNSSLAAMAKGYETALQRVIGSFLQLLEVLSQSKERT